jgi:hypothetical protein
MSLAPNRVCFFIAIPLAALILSARARADVAFSGCTIAQTQSLTSVCSCLPILRKNNAQITVHILPAPAIKQLVCSGLNYQSAHSINFGAVDGIYQNESTTITLRQTRDSALLCRTFAHELGHFVWQRVLTDNDRKQYATLYAGQKLARSLVTPYAATSVEEGFAEAFSYFLTDPSLLSRRDSLSSTFLEKIYNDQPHATK